YAKVVDFGIARRLPLEHAPAPPGRETDPGVVLGTVRYMSPEQTRGEPVAAASDVFSLGVVLYELTTGRHPFPADSHLATLDALRAQTPVPPALLNPEVPAPLDALVLQMLEKDPRLRPSAAEVADALADLAAGKGRAAAPAPAASPARHTVGRQEELRSLRSGFDSAAAQRG